MLPIRTKALKPALEQDTAVSAAPKQTADSEVNAAPEQSSAPLEPTEFPLLLLNKLKLPMLFFALQPLMLLLKIQQMLLLIKVLQLIAPGCKL
jgi:hypothetical protein